MKESTFEKQEQPSIKVQTISAEELLRRIFDEEAREWDKRFLPEDDGGAFHFFNPEDVTDSEQRENSFYSIIEVNDLIVGLARIKKNPNLENNFWFMSVQVDPKYQDKGYARKLIEEVCKFVSEKGCSLLLSMYKSEGREKLKHIIDDLIKDGAVKVIDDYGRPL